MVRSQTAINIRLELFQETLAGEQCFNRLKIAFHSLGDPEWYGGTSHLRSLCLALQKFYRNEVKLSLLNVDHAHSKAAFTGVEWDEILTVSKSKKWSMQWFLTGAARRIYSDDASAARLLRNHGINVVFGPTLQTRYGGIPTLSWLHDFQHLRMPVMFCERERSQRDKIFARTAKISTRIIVMSESVKKDFECFFPRYTYKVRILKSATYLPESIYGVDPKLISSHYHLPDKFIYLPNQFWKHKNHETVFKAVKRLTDQGLKVTVVCSGHFADYRHPTYFSDLWQKVSEWGIRDQIIYLGMIPYEHVIQLMRQSICVLNPSLFEGFGLTVDEAICVGKKLLLSDIEPFREQNPCQSIYFNQDDSEDLARKINQLWHESVSGPDAELEKKAREEFPNRLQAFAESFMSVVNEMIYSRNKLVK